MVITTADKNRQQLSAAVMGAFPEVNKFRMNGPDNMPTNHFGLFTDEATPRCVGPAVSARYHPHTRDDIAALVEAAATGFGDDMNANVRCNFTERGHTVVIEPSREYRRAVFGTDTIWPRLMVRAYFDRKFRASMAMYRDACDNLQWDRHVSGVSRAIRHTSGLRQHMDALVSDFHTLAASWSGVVDTARELNERTVSVQDFVHGLYPDPPADAPQRQRTIARNRGESIIGRIIRERQQLQNRTGDVANATLWELVNAVTGYVQHDKTRRSSNDHRDTFQRGLVAIDDAESNAAWDLAHEMLAA